MSKKMTNEEKLQYQKNVIKHFISYNFSNGNYGLFVNAFAQRFLDLQQSKNGQTTEEYKWFEFLFKNMGVKPYIKKGKICFESVEIPEENKQPENQNNQQKFFNKKHQNPINKCPFNAHGYAAAYYHPEFKQFVPMHQLSQEEMGYLMWLLNNL